MSIVYAHEDINKIINIDGNNRCVDCGSDDPQWASMNNSVFVCLNCAGIHRSLGVEISYIRSLVIDNWDNDQLKKLSIGGNNRFISNLEDFDIITKDNYISLNSETIKKKYKYVASEYYRSLLNSELLMIDTPEKPTKEEGQKIIEENSVLVDNSSHNPNNLFKDNSDEITADVSKNNNLKKNNSIFNKINTMYTYTTKQVSKAIQNTGDKLDNMKIKEKIKQTGSKTVDVVKDAGKYVSEKANKVAVRFYIKLINTII